MLKLALSVKSGGTNHQVAAIPANSKQQHICIRCSQACMLLSVVTIKPPTGKRNLQGSAFFMTSVSIFSGLSIPDRVANKGAAGSWLTFHHKHSQLIGRGFGSAAYGTCEDPRK